MTPLRERPPRTIQIIGFLGYGLILYVLGFFFQAEYFNQGFFVSLVLTPLCLGAMAQTVFDSERVEHERLAWDFSFNDPYSLASFDPHVSPNSEMLRVANGFYQLSTTQDGRTLVRLQTHYTVRSPFNPYLNWWGHLFLNDFQNSVLAVIKSRSEGAI